MGFNHPTPDAPPKRSGLEFEENIVEKLAARGEQVINLKDKDFSETIRIFQEVKRPTILYQPTLEAPIGDYSCSGQGDIIRLSRDTRNQLHVLIVDIKATKQEKTEHRVQVAAYAKMVQHLATSQNIAVAEIQGAILTQQEDGSYPVINLDIPTFDLDTYLTIIDRLVVMNGSVVNRVCKQPFEACFYHLNYKCDGCLYNSICMYDLAERLDLCLTPQITAVEKRVLNEAGVQTIKQLASLMDYPPEGQYVMQPSPAQQSILDILKNRWPVAPNLPFLVQRAKGAMRNFDRSTDYRPIIFGSPFGNLPSDERYPDLVKVFFDAQRDYLQNRLYLVSALVSGRRGQKVIVCCADQPPTDKIEGELLIGWVKQVVTAAREVSPREDVPVHLYCYNRYDQKVLLEALKRHLGEVAAIPAFFDLMTQSPALTQPMISFLSDEVSERWNMGRICMPLHDASRYMKFDWQDEQYAYFSLFRARMFDNRRNVVRLPNRAIARLTDEEARAHPGYLTIEAASRFNSQIPLEYVYAAWNCLPEDKEDLKLLGPFRKVNLDILKKFAGMRVKALAHIEGKINKSIKVEKEALHLPTIFQMEETLSLPRSLTEFVYMEHHTSLQGHLLTYSLSIDRRTQSGLAMLLRFNQKAEGDLYEFTPEFGALGLDPEMTINSCKVKEGDWVVANPLRPPLSANQIKHGRLAVVERISKELVRLQLMGFTFKNGNFRYFHKNTMSPEAGELYTIDPMSDDLNADKTLEALEHTHNNLFFQWLLSKPENRTSPIKEKEFFTQFVNYVDALLKNRRRSLTQRQRETIGGYFENPLLLVQGPPGTGKSYTLAWAILARIAAKSVQGKPCRVLISCKTHNAIKVVLKALVDAQNQVGGFAPPQMGGQAIFGTKIFKIVNDALDDVPSGVQPLNVYTQRASLENKLSEYYFVIGATSGGAFNLMKYRDLGGNKVDWTAKPFDLVVIDEASQASLPEGVLAGAFLKPEGQMIVVGDHRQMPPIIAHPWKEEQKRSVIEERPYISLFESLVERDFPCVRLDESFRLHEEIAEFLRENIYSKDGIDFHSKRKELIPQIPPLTNYVDVVLNPNYPIVVIEHSEQASQQYNLVELELIRPLIDACIRHLSLDGRNGIGIVVPHRAQKTLLRAAYPDLAEVNSIDTVERFQGDERDVIIVSATASDPDYVRNEADFLLNLNRLNVAISRPRKKLIVIASQSVVDLLISDLDIFENAVIWKRLYYHYTPTVLASFNMNGYHVDVRGRKAKQ